MMKTKRLKTLVLVATGVLFQFGGCATTNQLKDFVRTEIALIGSQLLASPFNAALFDLTGAQVVEEVVPSLQEE